MTVQVTTIQETVQEDQNNFQQILSDSQLADLFNKHGVQDERKRKLFVRCFFWLMVFSAAEPSRRCYTDRTKVCPITRLQKAGNFLSARC
jgi:hypothetical protein